MRLTATVLSLALCGLLATCGDRDQLDWTEEEPFDEQAAIEEAISEYSYATFEDVFGSYQCTYDCGGHNAGFEWAKENSVLDGYACSGDSDSFVEGCEAYGEAIADYVETARRDHP